MEVIIMKELLGANSTIAEENKKYFKKNKLMVVNLMGAPGAGKTTLIEGVAKELEGKIKVGVVEGDISSSIDADKLTDMGIPSSQINTCGECHLDAKVTFDGVKEVGMTNGILFIENVGNLICPAEFDLGESVKLLAASVPEGDDKPYKYVPMFSYIDVVALTKCDLKEAVGFDTEYFTKGLSAVSKAPIIELSSKKNSKTTGFDKLAKFLMDKYEEYVKE